jgi:hypothetical protein
MEYVKEILMIAIFDILTHWSSKIKRDTKLMAMIYLFTPTKNCLIKHLKDC